MVLNHINFSSQDLLLMMSQDQVFEVTLFSCVVQGMNKARVTQGTSP